MTRIGRQLIILSTGLLLFLTTSSAEPISIGADWAFSSGSRSAGAQFSQVGSQLSVTLTNTSASDALVPVDILTAVFFNISTNPTLSRDSATLASGSTVLFAPTSPLPCNGTASNPCAGPDLGAEWSYLGGGAPLIGGATGPTQGISSVGLGVFGPGNRFVASNYQGPASPNGLQYGITTAGDNPATGNTPVTGANALTQNSVVFQLGGLNPTATYSITDVVFQYGTSLTEPSFRGSEVPEPSQILVLAIGCGIVALVYRRKRRQQTA